MEKSLKAKGGSSVGIAQQGWGLRGSWVEVVQLARTDETGREWN